MAKYKKVVDPDEEITGKMFERAKELGYDVDNPTTGDVYRQQTKRMIEAEKKRKAAKK